MQSNRNLCRAGVMGLCAGAGFALSSAEAAQVTAQWLAPVSGSWTDPTKWSTPQFPSNGNPAGTTYHAVIDAASGPYAVTVSQSMALDRLTIDSDGALVQLAGGLLHLESASMVERGGLILQSGGVVGAGALGVRSNLDWQGGEFSGAGLIQVLKDGEMRIYGSPGKALGRGVENSGLMRWTNGDVTVTAGSVMNSGRFEVSMGTGQFRSWRSQIGSGLAFVNDGELVKTGAGVAEFSYFTAGQSLINNGVIQVENGELRWSTQSEQSGEFRAEGTGMLRLQGLPVLLSDASLTGTGEIRVDSAMQHFGSTSMDGRLTVMNDAIFHSAVNVGSLTVDSSNGTVEFLDSVEVAEELKIVAGTARIAGPLMLGGEQNIVISGRLDYDHIGAPLMVNRAEVAGSMGGAGDMSVKDALVGRARLDGTGTTTIEIGASMSMQSGGAVIRTLRVLGAADFEGRVYGAGLIYNSGELIVRSDRVDPVVENDGLVRKLGASAASVALRSSSLSQTRVEEGTLEFVSGGGTLIEGVVEVWGGASLISRGSSFLPGSSLTGNGRVELRSGGVTFAPGTFQFAGDLELHAAMQIADDLEVRSLWQFSGSSTIDGAASVAERLLVTGGVLSITEGLTMQPGAELRATGGAAHLGLVDLSLADSTFGGGAIFADGSIVNTGLMTWTHGASFVGAGQLVNAAGATLQSLSGSKSTGLTLVNQGQANIAGTLDLQDGMSNTGTLAFSAPTEATTINLLGGGMLYNHGQIIKTGNAAATISTGAYPGSLYNSGLMHVQEGALRLGRTFNAGDILVDAEGVLRLGAFIDNGGSIVGSGRLEVASGAILSASLVDWTGDLWVIGGTAHLAPGAGWTDIELRNGTIRLDGEFDTSNDVTLQFGVVAGPGALRIGAAGSLDMPYSAFALRLQTTVDVGSTFNWDGAPITLEGGTLITRGDGVVSRGSIAGAAGQWRHTGSLIKTGVSTLSISGSGLNFINEGEFRVQGGSVDISSAIEQRGVLRLDPFSKIRWLGGATVTNEGLIAMANSAAMEASAGFANATSGTLSFEVGGMKDRGLSGLMTITGEASLAGTLTVATPEAFSATWGDRWVVMTYGSVEGDFDVFDLPMEGFASRSDDFGASDLRWYAERGETEYAVGVSHVADIDHDGLIGFADLNVIASNFNAFGSWAQGDVDGDGFVGFTDLNAALSLFNVAAPRSVPGPATTALFVCSGVFGRRRRRS